MSDNGGGGKAYQPWVVQPFQIGDMILVHGRVLECVECGSPVAAGQQVRWRPLTRLRTELIHTACEQTTKEA